MRPHAILLDPGHGGDQEGHYSRTGISEKNLTLQLAVALAERLSAHGLDPHFTRVGDTMVSHRYRAKFARRFDLTLSLHFHATSNPHVRNMQASARIAEGEAIGRLILDYLFRALGETVLYRPTQCRITTLTDLPVVVLMCGMISHPEVEQTIIDGTRMPKLASAIADGVAQHFGAAVR